MQPRIAMLAGTMVAMQMLLAGGNAPAHAQGLPPDDSLVVFNRNTAVRERVIPGYEPREVRLGSLILSPALETALRYSDNVLALDTDRIADASIVLQPSAQIRTDWRRRLISLSARGAIERFAKQKSENYEALDLSAYGIQEFGTGGRVRAIVGYRQARESRESQNAFLSLCKGAGFGRSRDHPRKFRQRPIGGRQHIGSKLPQRRYVPPAQPG
jgi:hypothetical protein